MLQQLDVYSSLIATDPYALVVDGSVDIDPIQIRNISGLGPVAADINTSKLGTTKGEAYRDSTTGKRNIVITVGLNPDWDTLTIEALRLMLYSVLMPESPVRLVFTSTHLPPVEIFGYVETCEPNIFAADPEYQISILCPHPDFVEMEDTAVSGGTNTGTTYPDTGLITVDYEGSVETGFVLTIPDLSGTGGTPTTADAILFHEFNNKLESMYIRDVVVGNDYAFSVSTVPGDKYARSIYMPLGVSSDVLSKVSTSSRWSKLQPGSNKIQVNYGESDVWILTYRNRYGGL